MKPYYLLLLITFFTFCIRSLAQNTVPVIDWSTYYGGTEMDFISGVDEDNNLNIIVGGSSFSSDNISTIGSHLENHPANTNSAGALSKFDNNGNQLWGTYIGGNNSTYILDVKTDNSNDIIIVGYTNSSTGISTTGSNQEVLEGGEDGFIMKFNPSGQLLWGTYFGGTLDDLISGIVVDGSNNIYVTGHSESSMNISTTGSFQEVNAGGTDIFLAKFSASGNQIWGSYYGGSNEDFSSGIDLTNSGDIVFYGETSSTGLATTGAFQETFSGSSDAILGVFTGTFNLSWATYFGGTELESPSGLAVDFSDSIIIYGRTSSSNNIASTGVHQENKLGFMDTYLAKFNNSGDFQWGTYFGGTDDEFYTGELTYDSNNNIFLTGATYSTDHISTAGAIMPDNPNTSMTIFLGQFNPSGVQLAGTYYGVNNNSNWGNSMTYSSMNDKLILTGRTSSVIDFTTAGANQENYGGGPGDGFITALDFCEVDPTLTQNGITLSSNEPNATYQWYDCELETPISGETNSSYSADYNGTFYCEVTNSNCTVNSECIEITTVSLNTEELTTFNVFPNPADTKIQAIVPNGNNKMYHAYITDLTGRTVKQLAPSLELIFDVSSLKPGTYYLHLLDHNQKHLVNKFLISK